MPRAVENRDWLAQCWLRALCRKCGDRGFISRLAQMPILFIYFYLLNYIKILLFYLHGQCLIHMDLNSSSLEKNVRLTFYL